MVSGSDTSEIVTSGLNLVWNLRNCFLIYDWTLWTIKFCTHNQQFGSIVETDIQKWNSICLFITSSNLTPGSTSWSLNKICHMVSFCTHLGWCVIMTVKSEFGFTFLHAVRFTQNEIIPIKSVILHDSITCDSTLLKLHWMSLTVYCKMCLVVQMITHFQIYSYIRTMAEEGEKFIAKVGPVSHLS